MVLDMEMDPIERVERTLVIVLEHENKALGMSMAYGLKASLLQISKRFDSLMQERKIGNTPVYDRIAFLDASGRLLIYWNPLLKHRKRRCHTKHHRQQWHHGKQTGVA